MAKAVIADPDDKEKGENTTQVGTLQ